MTLQAQVNREDGLAQFHGDLAFEGTFSTSSIFEIVGYMTEKAKNCATVGKFSVTVWDNGFMVYDHKF